MRSKVVLAPGRAQVRVAAVCLILLCGSSSIRFAKRRKVGLRLQVLQMEFGLAPLEIVR